MNARRLSRMLSRPFHSATPSRQVASFTKQSKPLPKVLSSISFQKANSHSGGAVLVMVSVVIVISRTDIDGCWRYARSHGLERSRIVQTDMGAGHHADRQLSLGSCQSDGVKRSAGTRLSEGGQSGMSPALSKARCQNPNDRRRALP